MKVPELKELAIAHLIAPSLPKVALSAFWGIKKPKLSFRLFGAEKEGFV